MSSAQQQTQSQTTSAPWTVQQPYLEQGFGGASSALSTANSNAANPNYAAPSQFLAGFNPQQLATFNQMIGYGQNNPIPGQEASAGASYLNGGTGAAGNAESGLASFNPFANNNIGGAAAAGNAYAAGANIPGQVAAAMLPAEQAANDVTLPQMGRTAAATGNSNSSTLGNNVGLVQRGLGQQAEADAANLQANYYNTGAGLYNQEQQANNSAQLGAYGTEGQLGTTAGAVGAGALSGSVANEGAALGLAQQGGTGLQSAAQNPLSNQLQAYNFGQSSPFQALDNFWNVIGSGQWGGQSSTNSNTTYTPSVLQTIGGVMGMMGSMGMGGGGGMLNSYGWA